MSLQIIQPKAVHDTTAYAYAHAVRMADLIFVAGQVARDVDGNLVGKGDVRAQTEQVFKNLRAVLEAAGSGMHKVGKVTVFITRLEYRPIVHEIRSRVFKEAGHLPASTLAVVASLADPEWLVEIEAVALA
ncbi:MAG TPA: RidA family protein [Casimicrobiaceae bacterium]|nr:RidA family protein [Casimicrobiaceae bacterium]